MTIKITNPDHYYGYYSRSFVISELWYNQEDREDDNGFISTSEVRKHNMLPVKKKAVYSQILTELLS